MSLTIHAFFSAVDMVFLVKFYSWACGFFFAGDKRRSRPSPGRQMARPCGKTDDEENLLMKAIEKDVFYVAYPSLSLEYWGMNLQIVFPGNIPGGQHLALLYDTRCFSTLVELSSLGKCLVRMATKVGSPLYSSSETLVSEDSFFSLQEEIPHLRAGRQMTKKPQL